MCLVTYKNTDTSVQTNGLVSIFTEMEDGSSPSTNVLAVDAEETIILKQQP